VSGERDLRFPIGFSAIFQQILTNPSARRVQNDPSRTDARSESHRKITKEHVQQIEEWFEAGTEHGETDAHWLPPAALVYELDVDVSKRAMQKVIKTQTDYSKCIACRKPWMDPDYKPRRKEFCRKMLEERPIKEDYRDIRWSDEVYIGYGPQGKAYIYRKPGQRMCPHCI
jgi:hypothetical protein